ncbi:myb-like protein X [Schistocerca americana]|uniref:myb-like protein X n=1 Tax=Schistocerca americana TaxID=7009 RepID=UPI001F4F79C6|nr:myb-like protein X [Schistocerca americana]
MADDKGKPTNSVDDGDDTVVKSYPLRSRTGTGRPDSRMERTADDDGVRDVLSQQSSSQQAGENSMVEMMRIFFQEREQEKLEREAYKLQEQRDREQEKLEREAYKLQEQRDREQEKLEREAYKLQKQRDREQEKREREAYKLQKQRDRQEREQKEREKERETERKWFDLNTMTGTMKNRIEGILQKVDACESTVGNVHKDIEVQIESCQAITTEVSKKSAEVGAKVNKLADHVVTLQGQVNDLTQALSEINIEKRVNDAAANVRSTIGKEFVEWVETKEQYIANKVQHDLKEAVKSATVEVLAAPEDVRASARSNSNLGPHTTQPHGVGADSGMSYQPNNSKGQQKHKFQDQNRYHPIYQTTPQQYGNSPVNYNDRYHYNDDRQNNNNFIGKGRWINTNSQQQ